MKVSKKPAANPAAIERRNNANPCPAKATLVMMLGKAKEMHLVPAYPVMAPPMALQTQPKIIGLTFGRLTA